MLNNTTLVAYQNDQLIFSSEKNWLYPLFDLSDFLKRQKIADVKLMVEDKVVGRASALILVYLGARQVKAEVLSRLGEEILVKFNIQFQYDQLVDEISCATETLLKEESDPAVAFQLILDRIQKP
jgi:hypothetical protein